MGKGIHRLSTREVETAKDGDHSDGGGLILRIRSARESKTGKPMPAMAAWVFRYTSPTTAARREMGLGPLNVGDPGGSLRVARDAADKARTQLQAKLDPIEERERAQAGAAAQAKAEKVQRQRQALTFGRFARQFHEEKIEPHLTAKHAAQWVSSLENHLKPTAMWSMPLAQIEAQHVLEALNSVRALGSARAMEKGSKIPETLRRVRSRVEAIFARAVVLKHCTHNPAADVRAEFREPASKKRKRGHFRALDYRELPSFMKTLREAEGTAARALEFGVLCAARTGEIIGCRWDEIDLQAGTWVIPGERMKAGEPHTVFLSKEARAVIAGQVGTDEAFVFPSNRERRRPLSNMAMLALLDRLDMRSETTVHGACRAGFSTWAYETNAAREDVIEAALAHREADRVKAAYSRAQFAEERSTLMQAWAEYLMKARSNVVPLRAA